jgi:hypothetical protein
MAQVKTGARARCICGWREDFYADILDVDAERDRRFETHVASGQCPERRDAQGNIVIDGMN